MAKFVSLVHAPNFGCLVALDEDGIMYAQDPTTQDWHEAPSPCDAPDPDDEEEQEEVENVTQLKPRARK